MKSKYLIFDLKNKDLKLFSYRFPVLKEVYENEHTYLLYPSKDSISIENLPKFDDGVVNISNKIHIILLDGTWNQASG